MRVTISNAMIAALILGTTSAAPTSKDTDPKDNTQLIGDLITAPTQIKRYQKLLTDENGKLLEGDALTKATIWDFEQNSSVVPGGAGGTSSTANLESFPFLINGGLSLIVATLGPCGLVLPHVHPRANEFFVLTEGEADFGTLLEMGLLQDGSATPEIRGKLTKNKGTLFPKGSVHYQVNNHPDCKSSTAVVALESEDAGATPILMDPLPGNATVGMGRRVDAGDFETVRAVTPLHIAKIVDECLARCHSS